MSDINYLAIDVQVAQTDLVRDANASVAVGDGGALKVGDARQAPNGLDQLFKLLLGGLGAGGSLRNWQGLGVVNERFIIVVTNCFAVNDAAVELEDSQEDDNLGQHLLNGTLNR